MRLVEVDPGVWVDPDEVAAVHDSYVASTACVVLRSGHEVQTLAPASSVIERLREVAGGR